MSGSGNVDGWITDFERRLEIMKKGGLKTGSICRVPEKIREANVEKSKEWYTPRFVAMGPIHRGATIDLQTMEWTKWCYADKFLSRVTQKQDLIHSICNEIKRLESIIRASYGDTIQMGTEEFARNMFLDACFFNELLFTLSQNGPIPSDLGLIDDDRKISRLLTDLMLLENQVPFLVNITTFAALTTFSTQEEVAGIPAVHPANLVASLFERNVALDGACHFLHLIHLCSPDPYQRQDIPSTDPLQLHRCARMLQAFGITITGTASLTTIANVNTPGTEPSALRKFMDKFEFRIEFNETQLIIPTLHIKEATEFIWRNFIAWEQIGGSIGVGYKFTSYAYFFKGLVCSIHDVQLLREKEVIKVHTEANDEDLLIMFQSIAAGAKLMDARYNRQCEDLNKANVKGVAGWRVLVLRMAWHDWRLFQEWLQRGLISMLLSFINMYLGTPWKFLRAASVVILVLTIMQTIYAARSSH